MNLSNHPLFNMLQNGAGGQPQPQSQQPPISGGPQFQNPVQKMKYILQAMQNPAQFVRQSIPNIPEEAFRDPTGNAVLSYMMNNMGVTQQDVQRVSGQIPKF